MDPPAYEIKRTMPDFKTIVFVSIATIIAIIVMIVLLLLFLGFIGALLAASFAITRRIVSSKNPAEFAFVRGYKKCEIRPAKNARGENYSFENPCGSARKYDNPSIYLSDESSYKISDPDSSPVMCCW